MTQPQIEIIPLRPAVRTDAPVTLDVLLRITPPTSDRPLTRPPLNLALVLDRSGSMSAEKKLTYAKEAAIGVIEQLLPTDRVSVIIFDDEVTNLVPSTLATDKNQIISLIRSVAPGGSTALHGGWKAGVDQVRRHLIPGGLNRVLLLSDGLANVGITEPDAIAGDVHSATREGITTSTLGVGLDYNEDLMEAMARSGDGNYYFIESPTQLPTIFATELHGLMATVGQRVSLGIEPAAGVVVADVLNDFDPLPTGRWKLPNLVHGMPITVVVRLNVPASSGEVSIAQFRLAWTAPGSEVRQVLLSELRLPAVDLASWNALVPVATVQEQVGFLLIARAKKQAALDLARGDRAATMDHMIDAQMILKSMPLSPDALMEAAALDEIAADLSRGEETLFQKKAKYQGHQRRSSKPYDPS